MSRAGAGRRPARQRGRHGVALGRGQRAGDRPCAAGSKAIRARRVL